MSRQEFSVKVKKIIARRSGGVCERARWRPGEVCTRPAKQFDHLEPDTFGGKPTTENGAHLCDPCHVEKTQEEDMPAWRKRDKLWKRDMGIKPKGYRPIRSRGFELSPKTIKRQRNPKRRLPPTKLFD